VGGFLTFAAGKGASIFKMMEDTPKGYVRDAELFKDHAGADYYDSTETSVWHWGGLRIAGGATPRLLA